MDLLAAQDVIERINADFTRYREYGDFTVSGGSLVGVEVPDGAYFWVSGSTLNDGLHVAPDSGMEDESFTGEVDVLAIPKTFQRVVENMSDWVKKHPSTGYSSESFGGYSYSMPSNSKTGMAADVFDVFRTSLNRWRRLPCL